MESRVYEGGNVRIRVVRNARTRNFTLNVEYPNALEVNGKLNVSMKFYPDWTDVERYINRVRW